MNPKKRHFNIVQVTPEMAAEWLKKTHRNRPIAQTTVESYANTMRNGEWKANTSSIAFCNPFTDPQTKKRVDETLIDGQHRLAAVVISGCTVPMTVWWGCDVSEMETLDQGHKRSNGDLLHLAAPDIKDATVVATVTGSFATFGLDYKEHIRFWVTRRVIQHLGKPANAVAGYRNRMGRLMTREVAAAFFLGQLVNATAMAGVAEKLTTGIGMTEKDPVRIFFRYLHNHALKIGNREGKEEHWFKVSNAVALCLQGREMEHLVSNESGLAWLRNSAKAKLEPVLTELYGAERPKNFYNPQKTGIAKAKKARLKLFDKL